MEGFKIHKEVQKIENKIIETRRKIHSNPEISKNEIETANLIINYLKNLNMKIITNIAETGVVAILEGKFSGPCIMLRANMDALPLQEKTGLEISSKNKGIHHACGHDRQ